LLAILFRVSDEAPLIVAANREEAYARRGTPPQRVCDPVPFLGGLDPVAGGTWLGVNARGLLVAVTNRSKSDAPHLPRSRGLLVRDLLQQTHAAAARDAALSALSAAPYAGCNLLLADLADAYVIHAGDWLRALPLAAGIHVLTRGSVNDDFDRRNVFARTWLAEQHVRSCRQWIDRLKQLCGLHAHNTNPAICLHGEKGGTVSSSIVALRPPPAPSVYLHAQGPPGETAYEDYSDLFLASDR